MNPFNLLKHWVVLAGMSLLLTVSCGEKVVSTETSRARTDAEDTIGQLSDVSLLQEAITSCQAENDLAGLSVAYRQLGIHYRLENSFRESISAHLKGLDASRELGDTLLLIEHLNNIGTNYRKMAVLDESSQYYYEALSLLGRYTDKISSDVVKARSVTMNGIGNIQMELGNYDAALNSFREAFDCADYLQDLNGLAVNYTNIGSIYKEYRQVDSARTYYNLAMDANVRNKNDRGVALNHIFFGELFELENKWDDALEEYQQAHDILADMNSVYDLVTVDLAVSRTFINKGNYSEARRYLDIAASSLENVESLEYYAQLFELEYRLNEALGNTPKAFDFFKKSVAYRDSIRNADVVTKAQNSRLDYINETQQNQIDIFRRNYEMQRREKHYVGVIAMLIVSFFVALIMFLVWMLGQRKRKHEMLKNLDKMRTSFFTNITHEFRTPLTVILGLANELGNKEVLQDPEQVRTMSATIVRQGQGLLTLVNQLLDISKVESALGKIEWRYADMVNFVRTTVEAYVLHARQRGIEMIYFPGEEQVEMDFVPDYVQKIVVNLLSNSLKYTQSGGHIYVSSNCENGKFVLKVSDTGGGIPEVAVKHIFEPFYVVGDKSADVSTGVGLSLVKQLVEAMSGTVEVKSELGRGTTFTVSIPVQSNYKGMAVNTSVIPENNMSVVVPDAAPDTEEFLQTGEGSLSDPLVMIVEDNRDVAYYVGTLLNREHRLCYAENGLEALENAMELVPDIIITDLMMPEMDGLGLVREIRSSAALSHIPIIVITAKVDEEERLRLIEAGADAFVQKPIDGNELRIRVQSLLKQRSTLRDAYSNTVATAAGSPAMTNSDGTEMSKADKAFLGKFVDYVLSSLSQDKPADIASIASHMCVSPRQLSRKINALTGESTSSYVNRIKLNKAKQLLDADNTTPIADVAMSCGFEDFSYFGKLFRQYEGISPSQYRKRVL